MFTASTLAKKIVAAPPEELEALYRQAALEPSVFKAIFNTYHGDTVSKAKLAQRASDLKVHPEETETCADIYISALSLAKLVSVEGDKVTHISDVDVNFVKSAEILDEKSRDGIDGEDKSIDALDDVDGVKDSEGNEVSANGGSKDKPLDRKGDTTNTFGPKAVFNVNVTLDSSLDIEKLQKQLELLRKFGAI